MDMFSDRNQSKAGSSVHLDYIGWTQADACASNKGQVICHGGTENTDYFTHLSASLTTKNALFL